MESVLDAFVREDPAPAVEDLALIGGHLGDVEVPVQLDHELPVLAALLLLPGLGVRLVEHSRVLKTHVLLYPCVSVLGIVETILSQEEKPLLEGLVAGAILLKEKPLGINGVVVGEGVWGLLQVKGREDLRLAAWGVEERAVVDHLDPLLLGVLCGVHRLEKFLLLEKLEDISDYYNLKASPV